MIFVFGFEQVFVEIVVTNFFMAGYALCVSDFIKIVIVETVICGCVFEIAVAGKASRIINILFAAASQFLPVERGLISCHRNPGVVCS